MKSVKGGGSTVGSMNRKLLASTDVTNVSLERDYFERLGRYPAGPACQLRASLPCHGCQTSPELAPRRAAFASRTLRKV